VFVSTKPLHVSVFFHDNLQGVLRCAFCRYSIPPADLRSLSSYYIVMWPHVYVICVCLVFLFVGDLLVKPALELEFFIEIILPAPLWPWGCLSLYRKWGPGNFLGGQGGRCVGLTTLPPSYADCLEIWESSTSWNHQGLSRHVMGLPYLFNPFGRIMGYKKKPGISHWR
jgi:hypothetical protein